MGIAYLCLCLCTILTSLGVKSRVGNLFVNQQSHLRPPPPPVVTDFVKSRIKKLYMCRSLYNLVCSTMIFLHDLSLNRRKSDWFLSSIYWYTFSTKGTKCI